MIWQLLKSKARWLAGLACISSFFLLLAFRLELFSSSRTPPETLPPAILTDRESWRVIRQGGERIGYAQSRLTRVPGGFRLAEEVFMRLNQLGTVQEVQTGIQALLDEQGGLVSFTYRLDSGIFRYELDGRIEPGGLRLLAGPPGDRRETLLPLADRPQLAALLPDNIALQSWQEGQSRSFTLLDPTLTALTPATVTYLGPEKIVVAGKAYLAGKYAVEFAGVRQEAWIAQDGRLLREAGLLGLESEEVNPEEVNRDFPVAGGKGLAEVASLAADRPIADPGALRRLVVRLRNLPAQGINLEGGRQKQVDGRLIIEKESFPDKPLPPKDRPDTQKYLAATTLIQADHPLVKETLSRIVSPGDPPAVKGRKILTWVYKNIDKKPVFSVPNALDTLKKRQGDCNEHAALTAALGRAAGIPTIIEAGLVYQAGRFYYHAWNAFYLDGWVTADATLGQMPADVTHIRLIRDEGAELLGLLAVMGRLEIEILEMHP